MLCYPKVSIMSHLKRSHDLSDFPLISWLRNISRLQGHPDCSLRLTTLHFIYILVPRTSPEERDILRYLVESYYMHVTST